MVAFGDEPVDGGLQFDNGSEHAAFETPLGELGEKALHRIEPGTRCWGEVELPSWVAIEPGPDVRVFVSGIIVENGVDDLARRNLGLDGIEEADEFLMAVTLHISPGHGSIEDVRAANNVVVPCRL